MSSSGKPHANPDDGDGKSTRIRLLVAVAAVVLAAAGLIVWRVVPHASHDSSTASSGAPSANAPSGAPGALNPGVTGEAVKQVLLDGPELMKMLDQPFKSTTSSPIYGGFDQMENPPVADECVGVINVAPQPVYRSADVQSYARQTWADTTPGEVGVNRLSTGRFSTKVMFVQESVVALPSAAAARALFAKSAEQWKHCDGHPVNHDTSDAGGVPPLPGTEMHITDVRVTDTVLAASIVLDRSTKAPDTRAVGVRGNCIVGVLIAFTGAEHATGSADPETSSIAVVQAMMDKVPN